MRVFFFRGDNDSWMTICPIPTTVCDIPMAIGIILMRVANPNLCIEFQFGKRASDWFAAIIRAAPLAWIDPLLG